MGTTVKLDELYPNGLIHGDGIFSDFETYNIDIPWEYERISSELDVLYYSKSGEKTVSPLLSKLVGNARVLNSTNREKVVRVLFTMFGVQWAKLYETLNFEYNPIENYRMFETEDTQTHNESSETETGTVSRDADNQYVHTGTDAKQNNLTETETGTVSREANNQRTDTGTLSNSENGSQANSVYGFNSSAMVDSDASSVTNSNTETHNLTLIDVIDEQESRNLSKLNTGTVTETKNLTDTETLDETETRNLSNESESDGSNVRQLTRSGNIGVTTSQQMIESERSLWRWNFFSVVFSDIDSVLCLDVYEYSECEV